MDSDDFNCPTCNSTYDEKKYIPRMLIICGHTYCQECLRNIHFNPNENVIKCPEDQTRHDNIKNIEDLPKNLTLINLIKKASSKRKNSRTFTEQKRASIGMLTRSSIPRVNGKNYFSSMDENTLGYSHNPLLSQKEEFSPSNSISRKSLNNIQNNYYNQNNPATSEFSLYDVSSNVNLYCNKHRRPLEIACLDHRIKICTSCALFGEHKHHNLKSEEDIIKDITVKAEGLIDMYELIEKNSEVFENNLTTHQKEMEESKVNLKQKNQKIKEKTKMFFKELRFLLKTKEKEIEEILDGKLEKTFSKNFEYLLKIPKEIRKKIGDWKIEAQDYLDNLNNVNESNESLFEFLENKIDLVTPADKLIADLETANQIFINKIGNTQLDFDVECNFNLFNNHFDNFCKVTERTLNENCDVIESSQEKTNTNTTSIININKASSSHELIKTPVNSTNKKNFENDCQFSNTKYETDKNMRIMTEPNIEEDEEKIEGRTLSNINFAHSMGNIFDKNSNNNLNDQKSFFNSPNRYSKIVNNFDVSYYSNYNMNYNPFVDGSFMSCENDYNSNHNTFFKDSRPSAKNKILIENSFSSETRLNTTTSLTNVRKPISNSLSSDKIVFIKNQLKNEVANFTGYLIEDEGAKKISEILLSNQFSQSLNKKPLPIKIKELKLTKVGIGDEGFSHIANSVSKINTIHLLNLSKNKLKDESCVEILNLIKNNKNLKSLNLTFNNLSQAVKDKIKTIGKNLNNELKIEI